MQEVIIETRYQRLREQFAALGAAPELDEPIFTWVELSGRGTVSSWVRFHQEYFREGPFEVPYVVAEVTLAEGPRLYALLDGAAGERAEPHGGMAVEIVYDDVSEDLTLARVRPVGPADPAGS